MDFGDLPDLYSLLGVGRGATEEEILKAYRKAAMSAHPDRKGGSVEAMQELNRAKDILLNATLAAEYDEFRCDNDEDGSYASSGVDLNAERLANGPGPSDAFRAQLAAAMFKYARYDASGASDNWGAVVGQRLVDLADKMVVDANGNAIRKPTFQPPKIKCRFCNSFRTEATTAYLRHAIDCAPKVAFQQWLDNQELLSEPIDSVLAMSRYIVAVGAERETGSPGVWSFLKLLSAGWHADDVVAGVCTTVMEVEWAGLVQMISEVVSSYCSASSSSTTSTAGTPDSAVPTRTAAGMDGGLAASSDTPASPATVDKELYMELCRMVAENNYGLRGMSFHMMVPFDDLVQGMTTVEASEQIADSLSEQQHMFKTALVLTACARRASGESNFAFVRQSLAAVAAEPTNSEVVATLFARALVHAVCSGADFGEVLVQCARQLLNSSHSSLSVGHFSVVWQLVTYASLTSKVPARSRSKVLRTLFAELGELSPRAAAQCFAACRDVTSLAKGLSRASGDTVVWATGLVLAAGSCGNGDLDILSALPLFESLLSPTFATSDFFAQNSSPRIVALRNTVTSLLIHLVRLSRDSAEYDSGRFLLATLSRCLRSPWCGNKFGSVFQNRPEVVVGCLATAATLNGEDKKLVAELLELKAAVTTVLDNQEATSASVTAERLAGYVASYQVEAMLVSFSEGKFDALELEGVRAAVNSEIVQRALRQELGRACYAAALILRATSHLYASRNVVAAIRDLHEAARASPANDLPEAVATVLSSNRMRRGAVHAVADWIRDLATDPSSQAPMDGGLAAWLAVPESPSYQELLVRDEDRTRLRRCEKAILRELGDDPVEAALFYIDLSVSTGSFSQRVACLVQSLRWIVRAIEGCTEYMEGLALRDVAASIAAQLFVTTDAVSPPPSRCQVGLGVLASLAHCHSLVTRLLRSASDGSGAAKWVVVDDMHGSIVDSVASRIGPSLALVPAPDLSCDSAAMACDADYLGVIQRLQLGRSLETLADGGGDELLPLSALRGLQLEGCWKRWLGPLSRDEFYTYRMEAMRTLLANKGYEPADVQWLMESPLMPRDMEGWLMPEYTPLCFPDDVSTYGSVVGFRLDTRTGKFELLTTGPSREFGAYVCESDFATVLGAGVMTAFFTLDEPDTGVRTHPFHAVRYGPESLHETGYLDTMLQTDYLLKMFTVGVEVCSEEPFDLRPTSEGLLSWLPEPLQRVLTPIHARERAAGLPFSPAHRFWIENDGVGIHESQSGDVVTVMFDEPDMAVKTHKLVRNADGDLVDADDYTGDEEMSPEQEFARDFTSHYDIISAHFPMFRRLQELTKLTAVAFHTNRLYHERMSPNGFSITVSHEPIKTALLSLKSQWPLATEANVQRMVSDSISRSGYSRSQFTHSAISSAEADARANLQRQENEALSSISRQLGVDAGSVRGVLNGYSDLTAFALRVAASKSEAAEAEERARRLQAARCLESTGLKLYSMDDFGDGFNFPLPSVDEVAKRDISFVPAAFYDYDLLYDDAGERGEGERASQPRSRFATVYGGVHVKGVPPSKTAGTAGLKADVLRRWHNDTKMPSHIRGYIATQLRQKGSYQAIVYGGKRVNGQLRGYMGLDIDHTRDHAAYCRGQFPRDNRSRGPRVHVNAQTGVRTKVETIRTRSQPPINGGGN